MAFWYRIYGLSLSSTDPIPHLIEIAPSILADVYISFLQNQPLTQFAETLIFSSGAEGKLGYQIWQQADGHRRIRISLDTRYIDFLLSSQGDSILVSWSENVQYQDLLPFLLGTALGAILRIKGITCLHATSIAIDDEGVVFVGRSGAGKSTLTAEFTRRGYALLSEDIVALTYLEGRYWVQPGYASVRLWDDTNTLLYNFEATTTSGLIPKHYYSLSNFSPKALPISVVYLLGRRNGRREEANVSPITRMDGLVALLEHLYLKRIETPEWLTQDTSIIVDLTKTVPIRRLDRSNKLAGLRQTVDTVLIDLQKV